MGAGLFEAVELSDGSIRILMEVNVTDRPRPSAKVDGSTVIVTIRCRRMVRWEGMFRLPFSPSKVDCSMRNGFLQVLAKSP